MGQRLDLYDARHQPTTTPTNLGRKSRSFPAGNIVLCFYLSLVITTACENQSKHNNPSTIAFDDAEPALRLNTLLLQKRVNHAQLSYFLHTRPFLCPTREHSSHSEKRIGMTGGAGGIRQTSHTGGDEERKAGRFLSIIDQGPDRFPQVTRDQSMRS